MKILKNEHGYSLVTVLMIITVFMTLILAFMGQSFSSVKQNKVVESSSQSVAIAEMGISYYHVAVKNVYKTKQQEYKNKYLTDPTITVEKIATDIKDTINNEIRKGLTKTTVAGSDTYYIVNEKKISGKADNLFAEYDSANKKIVVNFTVTGTNGTDTSKLSTDMSIDLSAITIVADIAPVISDIPKVDKPTLDPNIDTKCIDPQNTVYFLQGDCPNGIIITSPNMTFTTNFQSYPGTIYVSESATGTLTMDGVGNKSKLKVYSDNLVLSKNLINVTEVNIEAKGNVTFGSHFVAAGKTNLLVGGNLIAEGRLEFNDNTDKTYFSLIRGTVTAKLNHDILIGAKNTMCVKGKLTAGNAIIRGKLYIYKANQNFNTTDSNNIVYVDENLTDAKRQDIQKNCGTTFDSDTKTLQWGDNIDALVDDVVYN
ncbi:hypothetical protein P9D43_06990 [Neobacillus niacini]|uniref:hypothetical protein n=1 Tax=Neobacillus niacini TaxID=86668 RepID=UPI0007ABC098|nr:hypothetical protein [Neobacillus niacini]MEC1521775.1 hypothetical protein [Neobacillus niacini]